MKRTGFTGERIIGILAEHEAGAKGADLCRMHGVSETGARRWVGADRCDRFRYREP